MVALSTCNLDNYCGVSLMSGPAIIKYNLVALFQVMILCISKEHKVGALKPPTNL